MEEEHLNRNCGASCPSSAIPPSCSWIYLQNDGGGGRVLVHRVFAGNLRGGLFWPVAMEPVSRSTDASGSTNVTYRGSRLVLLALTV